MKNKIDIEEYFTMKDIAENKIAFCDFIMMYKAERREIRFIKKFLPLMAFFVVSSSILAVIRMMKNIDILWLDIVIITGLIFSVILGFSFIIMNVRNTRLKSQVNKKIYNNDEYNKAYSALEGIYAQRIGEESYGQDIETVYMEETEDEQ